jgi:X-Pro dipeptidyl-peptidase-like protein
VFGYTVVVIDSRCSGRSPGYLDPFSARETQDLHDCVEWAGSQSWSTGRVGLIGISHLQGGTIPVGGVLANAGADALSVLAVESRELPLSSPKLWRLIRESRGNPGAPH